jgi:hypothetical protein
MIFSIFEHVPGITDFAKPNGSSVEHGWIFYGVVVVVLVSVIADEGSSVAEDGEVVGIGAAGSMMTVRLA